MKIKDFIKELTEKVDAGYEYISMGLFGGRDYSVSKDPIPVTSDTYWLEVLSADMDDESIRVVNPIRGLDYKYIECHLVSYSIGGEYSGYQGSVVCELIPVNECYLEEVPMELFSDVPFSSLTSWDKTDYWHIGNERHFDSAGWAVLLDKGDMPHELRRTLPTEYDQKYKPLKVSLGIMYVGGCIENKEVNYTPDAEGEQELIDNWNSLVSVRHVLGLLYCDKDYTGHIYIENNIRDMVRHLNHIYFEKIDKVDELAIHAFDNWSEALKVAGEWSQCLKQNTFEVSRFN